MANRGYIIQRNIEEGVRGNSLDTHWEPKSLHIEGEPYLLDVLFAISALLHLVGR
jgi:hypothetical protein